MKRLFVMAALAAAGCGAEPAANPPEGSTPVVLATFTGEVDMASGTVTIQSEPTALGQALGMKAMVVPAGTPGVTVANVAGTLWNNTQTGCGTTPTSGANVRVTSNYASPTSLSNVYAEITALTPSSAAACNSAAAIPGVTAANGGLWSYGNISAGANAVKTWAFTFTTGVRSTFSGRIVAFRVDAWTSALPRVVATPFSVMAGSTSAAVFLDQANRKVQIVNGSGTVTQSAALTFTPSSIATNATGSQIWVQGASRIARLDAAGAIIGEYDVSTVGTGVPGGIAVDPVAGVVWFGVTSSTGTDKVGWYDPTNLTLGSLSFGVDGGGSGLVAVNRSGTCYLYTGTDSTSSLARVNCSTKTVDPTYISLNILCRHNGSWPMVAGAGGDLFLVGQVLPWATVCKVSDTTVSALLVDFNAAPYDGLALGPDGNLWAMSGTTGLTRIWLGATDTYTRTAVAVPGSATAVVAGAGAVWVPKDSATAGRSDLTRVIP